MDYLRAGDSRMVRPHAHGETYRRRESEHVKLRIDAVVRELVDQRTPHDVDVSLPPLSRAKAAEVCTLLTTGHPTNRERLGSTPGVLRALIDLVDRAWRDAVAHDALVEQVQTDDHFEAAEAAAEAIWTLSFNSTSNHRQLLRLGAVEVLAAMVTARDAHHVQIVPRAAMWAAAALQNLAASYCDTPDGRCVWQWEHGTTNLHVDTMLKVTVDAAEARASIARMPRLVEALVAYACEGPVGPYDPPSGTPWPSRASVDSRNAPSVVPWAAAGALKNLALSEAAAEQIMHTPRSAECLCRLSRSGDWLESHKARSALYHLRTRAASRPKDAVAGGNFACSSAEPLPPRAGQRDETRDEL